MAPEQAQASWFWGKHKGGSVHPQSEGSAHSALHHPPPCRSWARACRIQKLGSRTEDGCVVLRLMNSAGPAACTQATSARRPREAAESHRNPALESRKHGFGEPWGLQRAGDTAELRQRSSRATLTSGVSHSVRGFPKPPRGQRFSGRTQSSRKAATLGVLVYHTERAQAKISRRPSLGGGPT